MAIERRPGPAGNETIVATACPYCDDPIEEQHSLADHLRNDCEENTDEPELVTDGGSKYVNETGPGYCGVYTVSRKSTEIKLAAMDAVNWPPGTSVYAFARADSVVLSSDESAGGEPIATCEVGTSSTRNGSAYEFPRLVLKAPVLDALGLSTGDDVRVYDCPDGLALVPADDDPMLVTDGGVDPFEESVAFSPHPWELGRAINGDHVVRCTFHEEREPPVVFCLWGEPDGAEWPHEVDDELNWTRVELDATTATHLARRAGEIREPVDVEDATIYVSAYIGRSKDSKPARDAPVLGEDVLPDGGLELTALAYACRVCGTETDVHVKVVDHAGEKWVDVHNQRLAAVECESCGCERTHVVSFPTGADEALSNPPINRIPDAHRREPEPVTDGGRP